MVFDCLFRTANLRSTQFNSDFHLFLYHKLDLKLVRQVLGQNLKEQRSSTVVTQPASHDAAATADADDDEHNKQTAAK